MYGGVRALKIHARVRVGVRIYVMACAYMGVHTRAQACTLHTTHERTERPPSKKCKKIQKKFGIKKIIRTFAMQSRNNT